MPSKPRRSASRARLTGKLEVPPAAPPSGDRFGVERAEEERLPAARHRLQVSTEVVPERGGLRLHAVRVEGQDRMWILLGHGQKRRARVVELSERREEPLAQEQPRRRLSQILARAS